MRKLCDSVDRFCLQHPRFGIPNLMKFLVGIMAVVFVLDLFSNGYASYMLYFNAELVLQGELWRLVTWMFLPTNGSLFWIFISLSFYYFIGTSIEEYWGTAKFTLFYLACAVLMVVFGMISILWSPLPVVSSGNLNQILFLAFATLYPDALIRVYLILPVKAKWLAALYVLLTLYDLLRSGMWAALFTLPQLLAGVSGVLLGQDRGPSAGVRLCRPPSELPPDHPVQVRSEAAAEEGPAAGLPPQVRGLRPHRYGLSGPAVPLLLQVRGLPLLL